MKGCVNSIALAFVMLVPACGNGGSVDDELYRNKMIENMESAGRWVVREGISTFAGGGKEAIHRKLVDEWGVQIWVVPWVETDRYLALFRIKARGINYDIHDLYREKIGNDFYEFWLIKVAAEGWSGERDRSVFFVTRSKDIFGKRDILEQSDQFIESYSVEGEFIRLPLGNMQLLYDMQAWLFPENYKESALKNKKVIMDGRGNISFVQ